ncbi:NACHT domain-containing protein [Streptomyces iranensis]|uniref:Large ATP-binding protein n=1 Tax=Streptomyces iranensis TaxID=576784 RepID=A0A061A353_9ACTN|nr:NACHT domain-containing protein [Streptomyces iranensis]MBP2064136.1 hypothetical protein [Streptomyces iranensis]CDR17208.1 large ATP-binding protein [Streptomyces iranensis]
MEPGAIGVGARAAAAAAGPLIRRLFAQPAPGAELVHQPVRISGLVAWRGEKRTLTEDDVRKLVGELVERAATANPNEPAVPEGERQAVTDALTTTLLALGHIGMADVQAVRLGYRTLAHTLKKRVPQATRQLSSDGTHLYNSLLDLSCLQILHFFSQRSTFIARTLAEATQQLQEQSRQLGILLERVPQPVRDAGFEHRYSEHIVDKHGMLRILGLRLRHQEGDSWPLDAAYLSLEATAPEGPTPEGPAPEGLGAYHHPRPTSVAPRRVEMLLQGQRRVLLRGHAGSGKTTLLQWLATTTARRAFPAELDEYNDCVPFVLQLRTLTRREALPSPAGFLSAVGSVLADAQPDGWAVRILESGRALLLIDGVDEVTQHHRERTREWLRELLAAYPDVRCLVTVRPSAVQDGWLRREGFAELCLLPMGRDDIAAFIRHWHRAARAESAGEQERARLEALRTALTETVAVNQSIARLAENPLMCALICALHRDEQARLPRDRKGLYESALELLLVRRDAHRSIDAPEGIHLSKEAQLRLLSRIAAWFTLQKQSEAEQEDVVEGVLAETLPSIREAQEQGGPQEIFRYLLLRSGLLHAPTEDSVAFIHRTFQDYLGAKALQETRYFNTMVRNAHDNQWEDVIRMAVAHGDRKQCGQLLRKLIKRGDDVRRHRHRLHLLAAACLEHATELDPEVRRDVEERMASLIPPRTIEDGHTLAAAGSVVLDLLPKEPDGLGDAEVAAVVATVCRIGGEPALGRLKRFRHHPSPAVHGQFIEAWDTFDCGPFAQEILSHLPENSLFTASSRDQLHELRRMGGRATTQCTGPIRTVDFATELVPDVLKRLSVFNNPLLDDLAFLHTLPRLTELMIGHCPEVRGVERLAGLPIALLALYATTVLDGMEALGSLTALETLALDLPLPCGALGGLPVDAPLTALYIGPATYATSGMRGIGRWPTLRHISLFDSVRLSAADRSEILSLPQVESLSLTGESVARMREAVPMPGISHLSLAGAVEAGDLNPLRDAFPGLRRLFLSWRPGQGPVVDLTPLSGMRELIVQVSNADHVKGVGRFPDGRALVVPAPAR